MRKLFKKSLACLLAAIFCVTLCVAAVPASAEAPTYSTNAVEAKAGETVTIDFAVSNFINVKGAMIKLTLPEVVASVTDVNLNGADLAAYDAETGAGYYQVNGNAIKFLSLFGYAGELDAVATLTFNITAVIADDAAEGTYTYAEPYFSVTEDGETLVDVAGTFGKFEIVKEPEVTEPVYNDNLRASSTSAIFESDYTFVYLISRARVESVENFYVEVTKDIYEGNTKVEPKVDILTMDDMIKDENGDYVFIVNGTTEYYQLMYKGIAAKEIASGLSAVIYGEIDGVLNYGRTRTDNLITYASGFVNGTDKFATTMVTFLNYGAKAQEYFNYNTTSLANAGLTDAQKAVGLTEDAVNDLKTVVRNEDRQFKINGAAVSFESQITVVIPTSNVKYTGNVSDLYVNFTYNDGAVSDKVYLSEENRQGDVYNVYYAGIAAKDMRNIFQMSIVDKDGNVLSHIREYSIQSYVYDQVANNSAAADLCKAMLAFGDAMYAYKN